MLEDCKPSGPYLSYQIFDLPEPYGLGREDTFSQEVTLYHPITPPYISLG